MSQNPLIPPKPAKITLDTLPQLFAHHKARFGGWSMEGPSDPPTDPPEGISPEEWSALGDPGKAAIVREREARQEAERKLAAATSRPAPPKSPPPAQPPPAPKLEPAPGEQPDIAAIVEQAVKAAIKPFEEREAAERTQRAADKVRDAVVDAAKTVLHDATDALAGIDLTKVVNDQGEADADKIKTELEGLVSRKPHLAKGPRMAPPGIGGGAPAAPTDAEKVKAVLADMQRATGVRLPVN